MSSSEFKVGDKVWVKLDSGVEELATITKLPSTNKVKYDNNTKEHNNKEHHNNDGNNNRSTTITDSIDSDKPQEIAVKSEATVSSNLTEYSE